MSQYRREEENPSMRGEKGGEAAMHSEKINAAQLAMYLKGIDYPASKMDIIQTAKTNGAPDNVVQLLNRLPERQYQRANEIEEEFGKMK